MDTARIPYQPALDGLRGISVAAILLFHSGFDWARGGFLGVSAFFTLSGYLITSLLLAERERAGRIDLRAFWARRLRRLMPAALLGLGLCVAYGALAATPEQLARLRGDVVWALAYAANWRFVLTHYSYAALFAAPSPVLHFWSLAIEEQFYALHPLLVAGLLWAARRSRRALGAGLGGLAAASLALTWVLRASGASLDRVYSGTDTRAAEFLIGALLALLVAGRPAAARPLRLAGAAALALLLGLWSRAELESAWLYRGGLGAHAVLAALVIWAAVQPAGALRWLLMRRPLRALGRISYGVYVYHWPLFLWLDAERTGLGPAALLGLRLAVVLGAASLSYRTLEHPIRRGGALRGWRPWAVAPAAAAALLAGLWVATAQAPPELELTDAPPPSAESAADAGLPRVALFGDSTAMAFEHGLFRWLEETGRGRPVQGSKRAGCGIADEGEVRSGHRRKFGSIDPSCMRLVQRFWASAVAEQAPDVAVVMLGIWDLRERRLTGERRPRRIGDPVFDAYLRRELLDAVDVLSAGGAGVAWLTMPVSRAPAAEAASIGAADVERYNELLRELAVLRPGTLHVVDLAAEVEALRRAGGPSPFRSDGVHLTPEGGYRLVSAGLGEEILRARASR